MLATLLVTLYITSISCSHTPTTLSAAQVQIAVTNGHRSGNPGGSFTYSAFRNNAYLPQYALYSTQTTLQPYQHSLQPYHPSLQPYVTYAFLPHGFAQGQLFYPGQIISNPPFGGGFYPGQVISNPVFTHPVLQYPGVGGGEVPLPPGGVGGIGGGAGGGGVQGDAPVIPPGQAAPTPVEGTLVDEDTVAIDAA